MPERYQPDDPREWANRAHGDLVLARAKQEGISLEDLCFHAQQAVEKAVKAFLIRLGMEFPYTNDVAFLLTLLAKAGQEIPERVRQAAGLSRFAVFTRYPGLAEPVGRDEYEEVVRTAEEVVRWAEGRLRSLSGGTEGGTA